MGGDGPLEPVWFCNYSIKGICLLIPHLVPQGTKFTLFGSAGAKDQPVLNGEVQWIRQNPDGVQIGCRIQGQYGRDLPRMFGNLDAVHFASEKVQVPSIFLSQSKPKTANSQPANSFWLSVLPMTAVLPPVFHERLSIDNAAPETCKSVVHGQFQVGA